LKDFSNTKPSIVSIGLLSMFFYVWNFMVSAAHSCLHGRPISLITTTPIINISDGFIYDAGDIAEYGVSVEI
jgi:hypothetical protein